jgi:DNA-directed RNA polymerase subunit H (RpoH/RPB5)
MILKKITFHINNMVKKTRNIKRNKHDQIINDYDKIKEKHLEKLANKILKDDEKKEQLKKYNIKGDFLNNL